MDDKPKGRSHEEYIVATVALSSLSHILMSRWIENHTEAELEALADAVERKLKNVTIEGLSYDQEEALVRRSVGYARRFVEVYRKRPPDKA